MRPSRIARQKEWLSDEIQPFAGFLYIMTSLIRGGENGAARAGRRSRIARDCSKQQPAGRTAGDSVDRARNGVAA